MTNLYRIAIDASRLNNTRPTGVENYAEQIIEATIGYQAAEYYLCSPTELPAVWLAKLRQAFPELRIFNLVSGPNRAFAYWGLPRLLQRIKPDLLFVPASAIPAWQLGLANYKIATTVHDLAWRHYPSQYSWLERWYQAWVLAVIRRRASVILVPSQSTADDLRKFYAIKQPIVVTPLALPGAEANSVDGEDSTQSEGLRELAPAEKFVAKRLKDVPFVLSLGRIEARKNLVNQLHGFFAYLESEPSSQLHYVLAGQLGYQHQAVLETIEGSKWADRVIRCQYVSDWLKEWLLNQAKALLYISQYEGFGLVALEAMRAKLPIVTADRSSLPEVAGEAAIYVDPDDRAGIAEAIHQIVDFPLVAKGFSLAGQSQLKKFNYQVTAELTWRAWQSVLPELNWSGRQAIVHDFLTVAGGAERVLVALAELYPEADIYSLQVDSGLARRLLPHRTVSSLLPSYLSWLPKSLVSLLAFVILNRRSFDRYELVISSSASFAKAITTTGRHLCYCHTPMRFAHDYYQPYLEDRFGHRPLLNVLWRWLVHFWRLSDLETVNRVDLFVANSQAVAKRIEKYYRRTASVIYPPVSLPKLATHSKTSELEPTWLIVSRLTAYKRIDLAIQAVAHLSQSLIVVGEGEDRSRLERLAERLGAKVEFTGYVSDDQLMNYYQRALGFIFAGEDDFGIAPVEAMAAGLGVVAYARGGALETVVAGETGEFFDSLTPESLTEAMQLYLSNVPQSSVCQRQAERFSLMTFQQAIGQAADQLMQSQSVKRPLKRPKLQAEYALERQS